MSSLLQEEFRPSLIELMQGFDCGEDDSALLASQWISGPPVLKSISRGTRVWLYRDLAGGIVGFGSLGTTTWRIPPPNGEIRTISLIPMLAVAKEFQGKPGGRAGWRERYSGQILGDLIAKAVSLGNDTLGLYVSEDNRKALSLYSAFGFVPLPDYVVHETVITMAKSLREPDGGVKLQG